MMVARLVAFRKRLQSIVHLRLEIFMNSDDEWMGFAITVGNVCKWNNGSDDVAQFSGKGLFLF